MADRLVRFTKRFFDQLDLLLPDERGADGTPSVTDFLVFDLPPIRDELSRDPMAATLPTDDPDLRVLVAVGRIVARIAIFVTIRDDGSVDAVDVRLDTAPND